ncbi:MAG: AI-2E family transporter, partial [Lachnospiraceae bacterium]|nr:AI-2E family transporter [Lachnospiraceae bacterium]
TFGPIIGALIGAFILLMAAPWKALLFLIFTVLLQFVDGYIVKPRLFGNTLGVSGLLILISVVVMGNMFGIIGILLAIPVAAILDFLYDEALLPMLEKRKKKNNDPWMLE